jgi:hypothetical protein
MPAGDFTQFAGPLKGVLDSANLNAARLSERQMGAIQQQNARAATKQRKHEELLAKRQQADQERFADSQRVLTEQAAERQRNHEVKMAADAREQATNAEVRQRSALESMMEKSQKTFQRTLEKEGEKEEKRETEKTSAQSALIHPLAGTVGDSLANDLPTSPGKTPNQKRLYIPLFNNAVH